MNELPLVAQVAVLDPFDSSVRTSNCLKFIVQ